MILLPIMPKGKYEKMYEKPYVMLLAHLAEDDEYVKLANDPRYSDVYKICDNSIIEMGESFSIEKEYEAAKKLNAQEIILPDAYPNGPKTIEMVKEAIQWLKDNNHLGEFKLMGVCHGENLEDFKATFEFLNNTPEIDVIGIPKVLSKWCPNSNRASLFDIWGKTDKPIHLLGVWYTLKELLDMSFDVLDKVRSCDTCLPAVYAINGQSIMEDRNGTIELDREYKELTDDRLKDVMDEWYRAIYDKAAKEGGLGN